MSDLDACVLALCDLLDRENDALSRTEYETIDELTREKATLIDALRRRGPVSPPSVPPAPAPAPASAACMTRLQAALRRNESLLSNALVVQRRMIGLVVEAARQSSAPRGYGASGVQTKGPVGAVTLTRRA